MAARADAAAALPFVLSLRLELATPEHAEIAIASIAVDDDLQKGHSARALRADGATLVAELAAADARLLRISASAFFDAVATVVRTLREFGDAT
jgi:tRNA threonylcarbamoyladenosine modification (KEOPS) complex  Pcc1 subunit